MARTRSLLQGELRQTKPFQSIFQEAMLSVLKTAGVVRAEVTQCLESEEVTLQQYNVLRILRGAGQAGLPTLAIAERLVEEAPGMTRLLDRLEGRGWVRRERSVKDRRQVFCHIRRAGLDMLDRLEPAITGLDERFAETLTDAEAETLTELLEKIRQGLAK
jgi:DNA-binding MarR family transcriptional regulator